MEVHLCMDTQLAHLHCLHVKLPNSLNERILHVASSCIASYIASYINYITVTLLIILWNPIFDDYINVCVYIATCVRLCVHTHTRSYYITY